MPCDHKFLEYLTLEKLDFKPTTLIVGTFNPTWPSTNSAEWFYGRTRDSYGYIANNFWDVLPRIYGGDSLIDRQTLDWKNFCRTNAIAITDLITCISDADPKDQNHEELLGTYSDHAIATCFTDRKFVEIKTILESNPQLQNLYFTRGASGKVWRSEIREIIAFANQKGIRVRCLLTPSGYAFFQQSKYNKKNPDAPIASLQDYILMRWKTEWHNL